MKDDPKRMTMARPQTAHAVPHVNAIAAAFALHRTVVYRESHSITLTKRNDLWPRLHARTLFGKYKFSPCKVGPWLRQQDRHLYGENMLAVKVLMQTVVSPSPYCSSNGVGRSCPAPWHRLRNSECVSG